MKHIKIHIEKELSKKSKSNKKVHKKKKQIKTPEVPVISILINKSPRKKQKKIKISNSINLKSSNYEKQPVKKHKRK